MDAVSETQHLTVRRIWVWSITHQQEGPSSEPCKVPFCPRPPAWVSFPGTRPECGAWPVVYMLFTFLAYQNDTKLCNKPGGGWRGTEECRTLSLPSKSLCSSWRDGHTAAPVQMRISLGHSMKSTGFLLLAQLLTSCVTWG